MDRIKEVSSAKAATLVVGAAGVGDAAVNG